MGKIVIRKFRRTLLFHLKKHHEVSITYFEDSPKWTQNYQIDFYTNQFLFSSFLPTVKLFELIVSDSQSIQFCEKFYMGQDRIPLKSWTWNRKCVNVRPKCRLLKDFHIKANRGCLLQKRPHSGSSSRNSRSVAILARKSIFLRKLPRKSPMHQKKWALCGWTFIDVSCSRKRL